MLSIAYARQLEYALGGGDHREPMRRIVIELPREDFLRKKGDVPFYHAIHSMEVLQILRSGPDGSSSIVRLVPKDPNRPIDEIARHLPVELQLLEKDDRGLTCIAKFGKGPFHHLLGLKINRGYFVPPIEVIGEKARLTYIGSTQDVKRLLVGLRRAGLRHRTLSISDLRLPPQSPLTALTEKQRRVLTAAFQGGYYDRPRRISSEALAHRLSVSSSTFVNHRLKAERRLLAYVLGHEGRPEGPGRN